MNTPIIDINAMAASAYLMIMNMQNTAVEMVGLDTLWCRAVPHQNSEDVIVQEYTLSNVECPLQLRIIQDKNDYQPGTFNLEMFGMSYENPFEISINIDTWKEVFGNNTAPLKGDIVLIKVYNRLYEVASMTIHYMLLSVPQYYKCTLTKYQPKASRKENEEVKISIDELTNAQDVLFGNTISNEVADAVIERETSYKQSTYVDPIKSCDLKTIITEDLIGINGNMFSSAYYDFNIAKQNVIFKGIEASYNLDKDDLNTHWIYNCWFRIPSINEKNENNIIAEENNNYPITLEGIYLKDKNYYQFNFKSNLRIKAGDSVILSRGTLFSFSGEIDYKDCGDALILKIPTPDVLAAAKKASKWWETIKNGWKIKKINTILSNSNNQSKTQLLYNLLSAYNNDDKKINISTDGNIISINFNNIKKTITLKKELIKDSWHYISFDFNLNKIDIKLILLDYNNKNFEYKEKIIVNKVYNIGNIKGFNIDNIALENKELNINMCHIRLYESEYEMGEKYKLDMYSQVTRNASKLIIIDEPAPALTTQYVSVIK